MLVAHGDLSIRETDVGSMRPSMRTLPFVFLLTSGCGALVGVDFDRVRVVSDASADPADSGTDAGADAPPTLDGAAPPQHEVGSSCGADAGSHLCGSACVPEGPASCGPSCASCFVPLHGKATCVGGSCGIACDSPYPESSGICGSCNLADARSCRPGNACRHNASSTFCAPEGPVKLRGTCTTSDDCAATLACTADGAISSCARYCVMGAPSGDTTACALGASCSPFFGAGLVIEGVTYGYCPQ